MNGRLPRIVTVLLLLVIAFAALYGRAFVQLYQAPHSYEAASLWIFENIPAGSKLLGPHWDDRLPVGLPGYNPHQYEYECKKCELPFYEADNLGTLDTLIRRISSGDYIIFPTPRIQGSVPRIPNEYPRTTALLQLLWNGQLGYQIEHVVKAEPVLFGIRFIDDLADESFSVYDHPKVTILKNSGRLGPQEIRSRVLNAGAYGPLPSLDQILLTNSATDALHYGPNSNSSMMQVVKSLSVVVAIALLLRFFLPIGFKKGADRGLAASLVLAPWLVGLPLGLFAAVLPIHLDDKAMRTMYCICLVAAGVLAIKRVLRESDRQVEVRRSIFSVRFAVSVLLVFLLSGITIGVIAETLVQDQPTIIGDTSALFALMRRAASGDVRFYIGLSESPRTLVPFLLSLLWPLKVASAEVQHSFVLVQALLGATVSALLLFLISAKKALQSGKAQVGVGVVVTICAVVGTLVLFHGILPIALNVGIPESKRQQSEVKELSTWAAGRIIGSPIFIEAGAESGTQLTQALGLPSFNARPFGRSTRNDTLALALYDTASAEEAYRIANDHNIELIFVGSIERERFSKESLEKFAHRPDLFAKVYGGKEISVYAPATSPIFTTSF